MPEPSSQHWVLQEIRDLREDMNGGFDKLRDEIRVQNGRVNAGEIEREKLNGRLALMEAKDLLRQAHIRVDASAVSKSSVFTKRETVLATAGITIILALIKVLDFIVVKLWMMVLAGMKGAQ